MARIGTISERYRCFFLPFVDTAKFLHDFGILSKLGETLVDPDAARTGQSRQSTVCRRPVVTLAQGSHEISGAHETSDSQPPPLSRREA
jgi:hypothetical protein